jgi:class 3 adenylate cyclase
VTGGQLLLAEPHHGDRDAEPRLQAVAAPGEVVIAASTRRLVGGMFDCHALGANELKGLPPSRRSSSGTARPRAAPRTG